MTQPLMPKATAVWLIENTTLTFEQVAAFCGLHELEVKAIADGEVAVGMVGADPVANSQVTRDEIKKAEADPNYMMKLAVRDLPQPAQRAKGPRYTPVTKRGDKPDAVAWLLKAHPELGDAQISRLIGTTKPTIQAVRDRTHWNAQNIKPRSPVLLGLCTQRELDEETTRSRIAAAKAQRAYGDAAPALAPAGAGMDADHDEDMED